MCLPIARVDDGEINRNTKSAAAGFLSSKNEILRHCAIIFHIQLKPRGSSRRARNFFHPAIREGTNYHHRVGGARTACCRHFTSACRPAKRLSSRAASDEFESGLPDSN